MCQVAMCFLGAIAVQVNGCYLSLRMTGKQGLQNICCGLDLLLTENMRLLVAQVKAVAFVKELEVFWSSGRVALPFKVSSSFLNIQGKYLCEDWG